MWCADALRARVCREMARMCACVRADTDEYKQQQQQQKNLPRLTVDAVCGLRMRCVRADPNEYNKKQNKKKNLLRLTDDAVCGC